MLGFSPLFFKVLVKGEQEKEKGKKKRVDYYLYFALPANYPVILVEKLRSYILGTNGPRLLFIMATNKLTSPYH